MFEIYQDLAHSSKVKVTQTKKLGTFQIKLAKKFRLPMSVWSCMLTLRSDGYCNQLQMTKRLVNGLNLSLPATVCGASMTIGQQQHSSLSISQRLSTG